MSKRIYSQASDWLPVIQEWQQSGLSRKEFCHQKKIAYKNFYRWHSKLIQRKLSVPLKSKPSATVDTYFVPIQVKSNAEFGSDGEFCVLRLSSQLALQIPMKAMTANFLQMLYESAGVQAC